MFNANICLCVCTQIYELIRCMLCMHEYTSSNYRVKRVSSRNEEIPSYITFQSVRITSEDLINLTKRIDKNIKDELLPIKCI